VIFWILTITMIHGEVKYGYKFINKSNCEKIGKYYSNTIKYSTYKCSELKN
jgi:hypothetical protein